MWSWLAGDWSVSVGAATLVKPRFEGSDELLFSAVPIIKIGRAGSGPKFSSRNDNISAAILETDMFRVGAVGKILFERKAEKDLKGLADVPFGAEVGAFVDVYPMEGLRLRAEARQGIRSHDGLVVDLSADAYWDLNSVLRLSGGPRLALATEDYFATYYGVTASQSIASGLAQYKPDGGLLSAGIGGAVTWKTTDRITTSAFGEYTRLLGSAADSSIVKQRGSVDQFMFGLSATYRFDFSL